MSLFQNFKLLLIEATNLGKDALHIYVGLCVMLGVAILFRRSLRDWQPLAAVLAAALAGELWDVIDTYAHGGRPRFNANWKDVWNTMFWPTILFLLARFTHVLKR